MEKSRAVEAMAIVHALQKSMDAYLLENQPAGSGAVYFLGEENAGSLDILSCERNHYGICIDSDWNYEDACWSGLYCQAWVYKHKDSGIWYGLGADRAANGVWTYFCDYWDDKGKAFCNSLSSPWQDNIKKVDSYTYNNILDYKD